MKSKSIKVLAYIIAVFFLLNCSYLERFPIGKKIVTFISGKKFSRIEMDWQGKPLRVLTYKISAPYEEYQYRRYFTDAGLAIDLQHGSYVLCSEKLKKHYYFKSGKGFFEIVQVTGRPKVLSIKDRGANKNKFLSARSCHLYRLEISSMEGDYTIDMCSISLAEMEISSQVGHYCEQFWWEFDSGLEEKMKSFVFSRVQLGSTAYLGNMVLRNKLVSESQILPSQLADFLQEDFHPVVGECKLDAIRFSCF